jgi:hypothetical protein
MTTTIARAASCAMLAGVLVLSGCAKSSSGDSSASPSSSGAAVSAVASTAPQTITLQFLGAHYPSQGHRHFDEGESTNFAYNSNPPTSGTHKEAFSTSFNNATPLPKYVQVHLLEHGNVLLQYNCNCPDIAGALYQIAYKYDSRLIPPDQLQTTPAQVQGAEEAGESVVVAPYPGMKHKIALTAWTRLGTLDTLDQAKIESFINSYLHNQANTAQ